MSVSIIQISPIKMKYLAINLTKHIQETSKYSIQNSLMEKKRNPKKIDMPSPFIRRHNIVNVS